MRRWVILKLLDERGQTLVEYSLILAFIFLAAVATVGLLSDPVRVFYELARDAFP